MSGQVLRFFPTPVIVDELAGAEQLNRDLEAAVLAQREKDAGLSLSNRGAWQSKRDFPQWAGEPGRKLVDHALGLAAEHTGAAPGRGETRWTVDIWANVSENGGFNMPHIHGGSYWSAVYYVRAGEGEGGQLVLHDPRMPGLRMHAPGLRFKDMGPDVRAELKPRSGLMVLFPAWLLHSVEPWHGDGHRISVAMNIRAGQRGTD